MKHHCNVCSQSFTRSTGLKDHYSTTKHIINQAICDGQIKAVYEKEKEEWDKQREHLNAELRATWFELKEKARVKDNALVEILELKGRLFKYEASNQAEYQGLYSQSQYENRKLVDDVARLNEQLSELRQELKREDREKNHAVIQKYKDKENELIEEYAFKEKEWAQERKALEKKIRLMSQNHAIEMETLQCQNTEQLN